MLVYIGTVTTRGYLFPSQKNNLKNIFNTKSFYLVHEEFPDR
jgi:hypothetical protein